MRRLAALVLVGSICLAAVLAAQDIPASNQTFRTGVDVIQIDVTVLDKDRRPIRGLTAGDFVVKEDGRPQRIVAVAEIDAATADPAPSAWMRYAPRDVATNDLADQVGDGQAVAIVLDDFSIPDDSVDMAVGTRDVARYIVNSLGPSDLAAVVFPFKPGRTQDFTHDRSKLLSAIDKFESEQPEFRFLQPHLPGRMEGDVQRYSPALGRHPCLQVEPVIPTLRAVTSRLAAVPNRRKALFFVSVGVSFTFVPGNSRCQGLLYDEMRRTFETAQRFNVNIHSVDPAGAAGYQRYLQQSRIDYDRVRAVPARDLIDARRWAKVRHDFLETLGEQTGGRPIVDSDDLEASIAEVFEEYGAYYLIGYETTNPAPDGKFRRLDVEVRGRDADVRTTSGRWAPDKDRTIAATGPRAGGFCVLDCFHEPPPASDFQLVGLTPLSPLRVRAAVYPIARSASPAGASNLVELAAVLTVRLGTVLRAASDTLTLIRTTHAADGRSSPPGQETFTRSIEPGPRDEARYDVWSRFSLPPGRHQVRFNATSRAADASGSVIVDVDVPDLSRPVPTASPVVLGERPSPDREHPLAALLPVVPTTLRDFTTADRVSAFVRLFGGEAEPERPVVVTARILDADSAEVFAAAPVSFSPDAFVADRSAGYALDLPLSSLKSGLHLLSITAAFDDTLLVRRDLVFRVR
jgi:VWFA-related protein